MPQAVTKDQKSDVGPFCRAWAISRYLLIAAKSVTFDVWLMGGMEGTTRPQSTPIRNT